MIKNNGILPYYANAELNLLLPEASKELHKLKNILISMDKKTFYSKIPNFYIYGEHRRGKTWFLHAALNHIKDKYLEKSIYYSTVSNIIETIKNQEKGSPFLFESDYNILLNCKILMLDDLGLEYRASSNFGITKIEEFLRQRFAYKKFTIMAGSLDLSEIEKIYGKSFFDFLHGEYVCYELMKDSINLSKANIYKRWKS